MKTYPLPKLKNITAAALTAYLQENRPNWHAFWLNDNHMPVIGILPKMRWILYKNDEINFCLTTTKRHDNITQHTDEYTTQTLSLTKFQQQLIAYQDTHALHNDITPHHDGYYHGLMGYISYDIAAYALNACIVMQDTPLAYFGHYDYYLKVNEGNWQLCVMDNKANDIHLDWLIDTLNAFCSTPNPTPITLQPTISPTQYRTAFDKTIDYLLAGDAYQVNLTQRWHGTSHTPISRYLPTLDLATQAPFAGFVSIDDFEILSVSPELFFNFKKQNQDILLTTKPIKGTRPRSTDPAVDHAYKTKLANSEKDLAENVMIVDLLRNDLGRYAKFGAVSVPVRFAIESFSNVHHMVSTVVAVINDTPILQVLFDSLPAGSITGTPKKRACEIIHELESHPRGAYCGTMGYLNFDNTGQWNVLIRTLQSIYDKSNQQHHVYLWAGGGITVLSDSDEEYQECLDKIGQIKAILASNPT